MRKYVVQFLGHSDGSFKSIYGAMLAAATVSEGRGAALKLLPFVSEAVGFRLIEDEGHRQVDADLPWSNACPALTTLITSRAYSPQNSG